MIVTLIAAIVAAAEPAAPAAAPAPAVEKKADCCDKMKNGDGCDCCKDMDRKAEAAPHAHQH